MLLLINIRIGEMSSVHSSTVNRNPCEDVLGLATSKHVSLAEQ